MPKTVLILGAGTGGLVAASRLRRMLDKEHHVILVGRSPVYTFEPSLSWVMSGQRSVNRISRDLRGLTKKGIDFRVGEVTALDLENKRVQVQGQDVAYDYLVIALGVDYSAEAVPGLHRTWTFYHPEGAQGLAEELPKFSAGRVMVAVPALPYKCPPAMYEGALLLDQYFRRRGVRSEIDIQFYTPEDAPLSYAGSEVSERVATLLAEREIGFTGGVTMKSVNHEKKHANFEDGSKAEFDMLVASPIHNLPHVLKGSGLVGEDGWVAVEADQLSTGAPDVFAVGDCAGVPVPGGGRLPMSGVFAHGEAEVVARNLTAEISGKEPIWAFGGQGACFMETGGGKAAYIVGNYFRDPPDVRMQGPSRFRHWTKMGFERLWLWRWF